MKIFALWGEIEINRRKAEEDILAVEKQAEASSKGMGDAFGEVTKEVGKTSNELGQLGKRLEDIGTKASSVGKNVSKYITAPLVALGVISGKSAIDFESAFAGVRKTVDATEEEFAALEDGIRGMTKVIPSTSTEIAGVAEAAGQLGIENENILTFTRVMTDLGVATNMSAEVAATALARLANITQMPQTEFDRLGSTIVALGNSLATTESEIVDMSLRLAGAGKQVGMTEPEILALAGSLSSVGIAADAGGSAFSKVMIEMQLAAETGGESLDNFAAVAGMSSEDFQKAFRDDAVSALISFISGLQNTEKQGISAIKVLDDMGIVEVRMRDALLRAAGAGELFNTSVEIGTQAWEENIALTEEAEQRYGTTESKMIIMRNHLNDLAITFGEILLPALVTVTEKVEAFAEWMGNLNPTTQKAIVTVAVLAGAIGPVVFVIGKLTSAVGILLPFLSTLGGFLTKTLIPAITGLSLPTIATIGAVVGLALVAYEVYKAWDEVKAALLATWELLKARATQLGLTISIAFEEMKLSLIQSIDAILEKLSFLENLPFGWGDQFKGIADSVSENADKSAKKLEELRRAAEENSVHMSEMAQSTRIAYGDLGSKIVDDITSVIGAISGSTQEQVAIVEKTQLEQTAVVKTQAEERGTILHNENQMQIDEMYSGMEEMINAWIEAGYDSESDVEAMAENIAQTLADYVVGESPPPKGPLADIDIGGQRVMEAWIDGAEDGLKSGVPKLTGALEKIKNLFGTIWGKVPEEIRGPIEQAMTWMTDLIGQAEEALFKLDDFQNELNALMGGDGSPEDEAQGFMAKLSAGLNDKMDQLDEPMARLTEAVYQAGGTLIEFGKAIASGNWLDAFLIILMETESFAKAMELLGAVLDPVIALFDAVLAPIINFLLKLWNGIIDALSKISIFGWKPFGGLADKKIGEVGSEDGKAGSRGGGRQVSEITGPTRDLLVDLLTPLANFGAIVAPIQDIRNILYERLPDFGNMEFAGAGAAGMGSIVFETGSIVVHSSATDSRELSRNMLDEIEREMAKRINVGVRGRGGR